MTADARRRGQVDPGERTPPRGSRARRGARSTRTARRARCARGRREGVRRGERRRRRASAASSSALPLLESRQVALASLAAIRVGSSPPSRPVSGLRPRGQLDERDAVEEGDAAQASRRRLERPFRTTAARDSSSRRSWRMAAKLRRRRPTLGAPSRGGGQRGHRDPQGHGQRAASPAATVAQRSPRAPDAMLRTAHRGRSRGAAGIPRSARLREHGDEAELAAVRREAEPLRHERARQREAEVTRACSGEPRRAAAPRSGRGRASRIDAPARRLRRQLDAAPLGREMRERQAEVLPGRRKIAKRRWVQWKGPPAPTSFSWKPMPGLWRKADVRAQRGEARDERRGRVERRSARRPRAFSRPRSPRAAAPPRPRQEEEQRHVGRQPVGAEQQAR